MRIQRSSALAELTGYCTRPSATQIGAAAEQQPCLHFALSELLTNPHAIMVVATRGDALFGLADLGLGKCEACQRLAMHLSML